MSNVRQFPPATTEQFTWVSTIAPNSGSVILKIWTFDGNGDPASVIASITAQQSDGTHYYGLYTMPNTQDYYRAEFFALKTFASSNYQFRHFLNFQVRDVVRP